MESTIKILLIDDTREVHLIVRSLIGQSIAHASLISADTGEAGLLLAEKENPDMILLDISLPGINGFEVCNSLKSNAHTENIPVVFLTSLIPDQNSLKLALDSGAEGFLAKPIDQLQLIVLVKAMVKIKKSSLSHRESHNRLQNMITEQTSELENQSARRQEAEEALRDNRLFVNTITENSPDIIYVFDVAQNRNVYYNRSLLAELGYPEGTFDEYATDFYDHLIHPDDIRRFEEIYQKLGQFHDTFAISFEYRMRTAEGQWRWFKGNEKAFQTENGKVISLVGTIQDITTTKLAEEAIRASEEKFRLLITCMNQGLAVHEGIFDDDGVMTDYRFIDVNASFERLTGLKKADILGKTVLEVLPNTEPYWIARYHRVLKTGEPIQFEDFSIELNKFYEVLAYKIRETEFAVIVTDVTERKLTELENKKLKNEYEKVFNGTQDAIFLVEAVADGSFRYLRTNKSHQRLTGISPEQIVGLTPAQLIGEESGELIRKHYQHCIDSGLPVNYEETLTLNGVTRTWDTTLSPLTEDGRIRYLVGSSTDISEKKESAAKLKSLAESLNFAQKIACMGSWEFDVKSGEMDWSDAYFELMGLKPGSITPSSDYFFDRVFPADAEMVHNKLDQLIKEKSPLSFDFRLVDANGRIKWLRNSIVPVIDAGRLIKIKGVNIDITEIKQAGEALRETGDYLENLINYANAPIVVWDQELVINRFNHAFEKLSGYPAAEAIGKNITFLFPENEKQEILQIVEETAAGKNMESVEIPIIDKNGHQHIALWNSANIYSGDKQKYLTTIAQGQDITDRKRADLIHKIQYNIARSVINSSSLEELLKTVKDELHQLLDTSNFFVALYDENRDTLTPILWADEKDTLSEWPADRSLSGQVVKQGKSLLLTSRDIDHLVNQAQLNLLGTIAVKWLGVPLKTSRKVIGVIVVQSYTHADAYDEVSREILEVIASQLSSYIVKKRNEAEIIQAKEQAEAGDRLKTAFMNNISHEIRTPLNGILGFGQMLATEGLTDEEKLDWLAVLHQSTDRLVNTINDFMDISLIASNNLKINRRFFAVAELLDDISLKYQKPAREKGLTLGLQIPDDISQFYLNSDRELIEKVLNHLVSNAVKFTPTGSITIGCHLTGSSAEIFVSDTGIGIAPEAIGSVFKAFGQVDTGNMRLYEGSGLGLAIADGIVGKLGGTMNVQSDLKIGSTFSFTLPLNQISASVKPTQAETGHLKSKPDTMHTTVLVAEDEQTNYKLIELILKKLDFELIHAVNGQEAIDLALANTGIGIVLMDLKMPIVTGFEATRIIKSHRPGLPIIATTAYALTGDRELALAAGCDDYLPKPIRRDDLIKMINKHLH